MEVNDFQNSGESAKNLLAHKGYQSQIVTDGSSHSPFADISAILLSQLKFSQICDE